MNNYSEKTRIKWLDVARGICMLSVIAGHMDWPMVNAVVYSYHLTVFFILSGYTLKADVHWNTIIKRFTRLMVPYAWTCCAITLMDIFNCILARRADPFTLMQIVKHDLLRSFFASGSATTFGRFNLGGKIGAIWFLPATFFAVTIVQFLLVYVSKKKWRFPLAIGLSLLAYNSAKHIWLPFSIQPGFFSLPFVLIGYEIRKNNTLDKLCVSHFCICCFIFSIGLALKKTMMIYVNASMQSLILSPIFALASSACILFVSKKLEQCSVLSWIGRNSIYFLCVHLFELETMGSYFHFVEKILGLQHTSIFLFVARIIFISSVVLIIDWLRKNRAS